MEHTSILYRLSALLFKGKLGSFQETTASSVLPQPPNTDDLQAWKHYWKSRKQPWRTEPAIDTQRQEELKQHLAIVPDIKQGIYPFKSMKLSHADIEWLLALNESGESPTYQSSEHQREYKSLDLRGADLRQADLHKLPLTCLCGGEFSQGEMLSDSKEHRDMAGVHLEGANLSWTHLEEANLSRAHLEGANLYRAHLNEADLRLAHLEGAHLYGVHLVLQP